MAIRKIVQYGDETLRKVCRPVTEFNSRLDMILKDMADTMYKAEGVGLAAPQVGILRRIVVIDVGEGLIELVNPEIIETEGEQEEMEGCLSCPDIWAVTKRPMRVTVRAQDKYGEWFEITGESFLARAFCHEIDHLNGVTLYQSGVQIMSKEEYEKKIGEEERR